MKATPIPFSDLKNLVSRLQIDADAVEKDVINSFVQGDAFPSSSEISEDLAGFHDKSDIDALADLVSQDFVLMLRLLANVNMGHRSESEPALTPKNLIKTYGPAEVIDAALGIDNFQKLSVFYSEHFVAYLFFQQVLISNIIVRELMSSLSDRADLVDKAYVFNSLMNLFPLVLSISEPTIHSAISLDTIGNYELYLRQFKEVFGKTYGTLAMLLADEMGLPYYYIECSENYDHFSLKKPLDIAEVSGESQLLGVTSFVANLMANEICSFSGVQGIQSLLRQIEKSFGIKAVDLEDIIAGIPAAYLEQVKALNVTPLRLPDYLAWFEPIEESLVGTWRNKLPPINERIKPFIEDMRNILTDYYFSEVVFVYLIQATLSVLVKGLNFDRAVFFVHNSTEHTLSLMVENGIKLFRSDYKTYDLTNPELASYAHFQSVFQEKVIFVGNPVFNDGWPFAAFPVIIHQEVVGLIYADKIRKPDADPLSQQEEMACIAISEEWRENLAREEEDEEQEES